LGINANETLSEIIKRSIEAEQLGLDYLWVSDVPMQRYSPVVASAIAAKTKRIQIGLGLISPLLHSPTQIANSYSTLVEVYGERFELCIGPGDKDQLRRVGVSLSHPMGITNYLVNARKQIAKTLRKNKVKGEIWLGAQGPKMLGIAHFFDGVLLNYANPDLIRWAVDKIGRVGKKEFEIGIYAPAYVYRDLNPKVYSSLRASSAVVALGAPDLILRRLGLYEQIVEGRNKLDSGSNIASILKDIPQKAFELFSIFKSSTELGSYLSEISKANIEHVVFIYPQNFSEKTVRELAQALKGYRKAPEK
jgi:hypothetical protein